MTMIVKFKYNNLSVTINNVYFVIEKNFVFGCQKYSFVEKKIGWGSLPTTLCVKSVWFYAPNFKKVSGAYYYPLVPLSIQLFFYPFYMHALLAWSLINYKSYSFEDCKLLAQYLKMKAWESYENF